MLDSAWGRKPSQDWRVPTSPSVDETGLGGAPGVPGGVAVPDGQEAQGGPWRTCPGEPPPGACVCQLHPILSALPISVLCSLVPRPPPPPCYDLIFFSFGQISCFCCDLSWCCFSFFLPFPISYCLITLSPAPARPNRQVPTPFIIAVGLCTIDLTAALAAGMPSLLPPHASRVSVCVPHPHPHSLQPHGPRLAHPATSSVSCHLLLLSSSRA